MNIEKLDEDLYYYTNLLTQDEQSIVFNSIKNDDGWFSLYDSDETNRDSNQSFMKAYRKDFRKQEYSEFIEIINKAFQSATNHYRKDKKIEGGRDFPEFKDLAHVDKHMKGTTYATHIDTAPVGMESYTVLFYLNDDYIGGELSFSGLKTNENTKIDNGIVDYGIKIRKSPNDPENIGMVDVWIKTKPCSIVIFPPLKPYPHTAHEVQDGVKYLIKGYWQVTNEEPTQWSNDPYQGISDEETNIRKQQRQQGAL